MGAAADMVARAAKAAERETARFVAAVQAMERRTRQVDAWVILRPRDGFGRTAFWAGRACQWRSPGGHRYALAFIPDGCGDYHRHAVNCASYYDPMVGAWYSERLDPTRAHAIVAEGSMSLQWAKAPNWQEQLRQAGYIVERAI